MADWTPSQIEDRLIEAAEVLKLLPEEKARGYFSVWPEITHDFADKVEQALNHQRRPPPSAAAISRMEKVLTWIHYLAPEDGKLVWARAEGAPWKEICWRFGIARATAHRRYLYGLSVIVWRLSGKRLPLKRSRTYIVSAVR
jgi:hypothetical protein